MVVAGIDAHAPPGGGTGVSSTPSAEGAEALAISTLASSGWRGWWG